MSFPSLLLRIKKADGSWQDVSFGIANTELQLKWGREAEELSFSLSAEGNEAIIPLFQTGRDVELYINNVLKFAGFIIEYRPSVELNARKIACKAVSYLMLLDRVEVNEQYAPTEVSQIIKGIAESAGLLTSGIEPTGLILSPNFRHQSGLKACLELAEKAGCIIRTTPEKVLLFKPRGFGNNIITNPSFEVDAGWTLKQYVGSPSVAYDTYDARSGNRCIKIDCINAGDVGGVEQVINVEAGKRYRFSVWMKGTNTGRLSVTWLASDGSEISTDLQDLALTSEYREIVVNAVAPPSAAQARVSAICLGQGVGRIDDMYAVKVHELLDTKNIIKASKSEKDYLRRNKIIVVGGWDENGQRIEAVVQEGAGDRPLTIYDLTITSAQDAERIARQKLEQLKVTPVMLDILADGDAGFEAGDYAYVEIGWLGIDGYYLIESVEHDFSGRIFLSRLSLVNPEYVHKDYLESLADTLSKTKRIELPTPSAEKEKTPASTTVYRLINYPPLELENAQNIMLDSNGYATLSSGATFGSFEILCTPVAILFRRWLRVGADFDEQEGDVIVKLKRISDGYTETIMIDPPGTYEIPYLPDARGLWTEDSSEWDAEGANLSDFDTRLFGNKSVKAVASSSPFRVIYPKTRDAGWNLSGFKEMVLWILANATCIASVRLHTDSANYFMKTFTLETANAWIPYTFKLSEFTQSGSPLLSNINYFSLEFQSPVTWVAINAEFVFVKYGYEKIALVFELSRPSADKQSPVVKEARFVWVGGE